MTGTAALRLFETHLTVARLEASVRFYQEVVGLELAYRLEDPAGSHPHGEAELGLFGGGGWPVAGESRIDLIHTRFPAKAGSRVRVRSPRTSERRTSSHAMAAKSSAFSPRT